MKVFTAGCYWLWVIVVALIFQPVARGGDHAGSGGGIAEKNLVFAHANLERYLSLCLTSESCRLTVEETQLLSAVVKALPQEGPAETQIVFASEKSSPGFFVLEGQVKIAKTGETVGGRIFVNVDLLYLKGSEGSLTPLSVPGAVALLVHELGHHQGEKSHLKLDVLGGKVETLLLGHTQTIQLMPISPNVSAVSIDPGNEAAFAQFIVGDGANLFELSFAIKQKLVCTPSPLAPNPKLAGFRLFNLHWGRGEFIASKYLWRQPIRSNLHFACTQPDGLGLTVHHQLEVTVYFDTSKGPFRFHPKLEVKKYDCSLEPAKCW